MNNSASVNSIGAKRSRNKRSGCMVTWKMISRNKFCRRLADSRFRIRASGDALRSGVRKSVCWKRHALKRQSAYPNGDKSFVGKSHTNARWG